MHDVRLTQRAGPRMRQRGYRNAGVHLVQNVAPQVATDAFSLSGQAAGHEIDATFEFDVSGREGE
jgi:hypothetical protein